MSGNKLVKNTSFYLAATYFPYLVSFITLPIYTRYLSTDDYAVLALIQSFIAFLPMLMTFQLHTSIYRFFVDYEGKELKTFISSIILFLVITSFTASYVLMDALPSILDLVFPSIPSTQYDIFNLAIIIAVLNIFQGVNMAVVRMREEAKKFMVISISLLIISILITIVEVVLLEKGINGMVEAMLISAILSFITYTFFNRKYFSFSVNLKYVKAPLLFSLPLIINALSSYIFMYSDRIILEKYVPTYLSIGAIGLYALADRIAFLFKAFVNQVQSAFQPHFYKLFKVDPEKAKMEAYKASEIVMLIVAIGIVLTTLFSRELVTLVFPEEYHSVWPMIPVLSTCFFFRSLYSFSNLGIFFQKKTIYTTITTFIAAAINICLNLVLIPIIGVYGAVFSTVASFFASFLIIRIIANKIEPIPMNIALAVKCTLIMFASMVGVWLLHENVSNNYMILLLKFSTLILVLFFIKKTGIISKEQVIGVLKK
jgi:O-antigen/teichoic acid export membrane protein|tara:strand:+ start:677 stop:2131 length:1455 start_codon:yes stop_codon:yes gene_type:complete